MFFIIVLASAVQLSDTEFLSVGSGDLLLFLLPNTHIFSGSEEYCSFFIDMIMALFTFKEEPRVTGSSQQNF